MTNHTEFGLRTRLASTCLVCLGMALALPAWSLDLRQAYEAAYENDAIIRAARSPDKMIETVEVFDIYKGKGVEPGKKSVAINVIIQPKDKTLSDAEIEGITKKIVEAVTSKCGASLRG